MDRNGCRVEIIHKTVAIYDTNGKLLKQESITDYTRANMLGEYATLNDFIRHWTGEEKKTTIRDMLRERGIDLNAMKAEAGMDDVDDYDFLCHVAYDAKPLTRRERANNVKKRDFLHRYQGDARAVLEELLQRYMDTGIYDVEDTKILKLDPFAKHGSPGSIVRLFGGKEGYLQAVHALEEEIYMQG